MKNTDKILLSIILLLTIFGLLYLIYKNPSCYKKKEGFLYTDEVKADFCNNCPPCEQLEKQKYHCQKKTMWGDFDMWNDESLTSEKKNEKLKHIAECYDTDCYEKCHNGPAAGKGKYTDASVCKHVDSTKNLKQEKIIKESDMEQIAIKESDMEQIAIKQRDMEQLAYIENQKQIIKNIKITEDADRVRERESSAEARNRSDETATNAAISAHLLVDDDVINLEKTLCAKNYNSLKVDYNSLKADYNKLNDYNKSLKNDNYSLNDDNKTLLSKYQKSTDDNDFLKKNNILLLEKNTNLISVYDENKKLIVDLTEKTNELKETKTECGITHNQLLELIHKK